MGTHALYGFIYKGRLYLMYCSMDGYLEGLGLNLMRQIKHAVENGLINYWMSKCEDLNIVTEAGPKPTLEERTQLRIWTRRSIFDNQAWQGETEWYWVLSNTQGSFFEVLKSGYFLAYYNISSVG